MIPTIIKNAKCIIKMDNCMLKPSLSTGTTIFKQPINNFQIFLPNHENLPSKYAVVGHAKTEFLNTIAMKYLPSPPLSRQYPLIKETGRYDLIEYLNFKENSGLDKVHLSARYESLSYKGELEMSDDVNSVKNYITGNNNYNSNHATINNDIIDTVIDLFNLKHLENKWINSLSNGQLRRARIAKSVLNYPKLLVIDDPFLGLDPKQTELVSESLSKLCDTFEMSVVLGLRFQDNIPNWITHIAEVTEDGVMHNGTKSEVEKLIQKDSENESPPTRNYQLVPLKDNEFHQQQDFHIEFNNASVIYKGLPVLKDFSWKIPKNSNWRILGENGTGKTTILSLITADHPQSWKSILKINNKLRKTGNGVTFFDVNNNIGISSPELHSLVPSHKTMNQIINNGLIKDIGNSNFNFQNPNLPVSSKLKEILAIPEIRHILQEFGEVEFTKLSITHQKLTLFIRCLMKDPQLIILDEAFSCMDDVKLMHLCHEILKHYFHNSTVLTIGHIEWELPEYDYVIKLVGDEQRNFELFHVVRHD